MFVTLFWPIAAEAAYMPDLTTFIVLMLIRSKVTPSTVKLAILYLIRLYTKLTTLRTYPIDFNISLLDCGRRMFLACLIVANKIHRDHPYNLNAWSSVSGLGVT